MSSSKKLFNSGDIILRQGEEGDCAYIVESGHIEIIIEKENNLVQSIGTRGAGSIIGEMALVDKKPRTATVKAVDECVLLEITQADFDTRLDNSDPIIQMVTKVILARYRDMMARAQVLKAPTATSTPENLEKGLIEKTKAIENIKLSNDMRHALDQGTFELYYQPILDVANIQIKGFEALIRWNHPEHGFISPDIFIPIAEDNGLIVDISRWVTQEACDALKKIKEETKAQDLFVSVNFSALDFSDPSFKTFLHHVFQKTNMAPHELHIEITERLLMDNPNNARDILESCQQDGMLISIDDFGTGYSSLSYLHHFPINILKVDRSFINNMTSDKSAFELVKSIISLSHNLGMKVIAEGIETQQQADLLKQLKCDQMQGYHYAKPMPLHDFLSYLQNI